MEICRNIYGYMLLQSLAILILPSFQFFLTVSGDTSPPYIPTENLTIDCGASTDGVALDRRSWTADNNPKFSPTGTHNTNTSFTANKQPISGQVPYLTARLSRSQFSYSFPVTSGPKFIRLYFYPIQYQPELDPANSFFSVRAGNTTILRNFSALLHAQGQETFIKEFILNVDGTERLNLTFSPDGPDSFAFINGIEIVSMPVELYYKGFGDDAGIKLLSGQVNALYPVDNSTVMEKVYRLNVGGKDINLVDDTGMYRYWQQDNDYVTIQKPGALPTNMSIHLKSSPIPPFSAPPEVYKTARTMGLNKTENENYRLTWEFPVDSGFTYFVRLHFCEFQPEITKQGDRVFCIFIANFTAEDVADIIVWSGGTGIPIYRDYAVAIGARGNEKKRNLSIAMTPTGEWRTLYSDSILNGVEIFKLGNSDDLAGANPDPVTVTQPGATPTGQESPKQKSSSATVIAIVGGVVAGVVVFSLIGLFLFRRRMRVKDQASSDGASWWGPFSSTTKSTKSHGSHLPSDHCRYFSLPEIKAATNNFDHVFIIGVGGFGNVYKGFIDGGATEVAIKRLNPESQQGAQEFKTEIEMLSQLRHLHLVSLIGYCNDDSEMILVYDYMSRGTLRDHLYSSENPPLPWKQRLEVCIGAARGLHYLHTGAKHTIIHRDVKTTNILLDAKWVAKVSDFGLSKVGPTNMSKDHVSTVVKGSFGYLDPEYYRRQQLTEKSDVYSFGVVLLEVLCARPPINRTADRRQVSLASWAQACYRNGTLDQIIDPYLKGRISIACWKKFSEVAMNCLLDEGSKRPSMNDVVWALEFALQLHESAERDMGEFGEGRGGAVVDETTPFKQYDDIDDSGKVFTSIGDHVMVSESTSSFSVTTSDDPSFGSSDKLMSHAVFSEIKNPHGR